MVILQCDLGVAARAVRQHRLLVVQEAKGRFQGHWGLPKGRVDQGESVESAVLRELKEETGHDGTVLGLSGVRTTLRNDVPGVFMCFDVAVTEASPSNHDDEISSLRWITLEEVAQLNWVSETMRQLAIDGLVRPNRLQNRPNLTPREVPYAVYSSANAMSSAGGGVR